MNRDTSARLTDNTPIVVNGMATSYGEMRGHAQRTADANVPVISGMAHAILFLLDEIEQREVKSRG